MFTPQDLADVGVLIQGVAAARNTYFRGTNPRCDFANRARHIQCSAAGRATEGGADAIRAIDDMIAMASRSC